jgi:hypothetical protein
MAQGDSTLDRDRYDLSDDKERNRILEEVLRDQARREVLRDIAYRRPTASLGTRVTALVLALAALGFWLLPMPSLRPTIAFPLAATAEEAGLRLAAYVQAQQVEAFRSTTGRLPDLLRETGEPLPGLEYRRLDARTYQLTAVTERDTVRWVNSDSFPTLLGDSAAARLLGAMP